MLSQILTRKQLRATRIRERVVDHSWRQTRSLALVALNRSVQSIFMRSGTPHAGLSRQQVWRESGLQGLIDD
jgi:hypothetical protein